MENKNKIYIIIIGVVAVTLIWLSQNNKKQGQIETLVNENPLEQTVAETPSALEGTLWISDTEARGNLMLVNNTANFYIKTSRDFNSLIGKQVIVSIDGVLDNFILLNIEENPIKDGYINAQ